MVLCDYNLNYLDKFLEIDLNSSFLETTDLDYHTALETSWAYDPVLEQGEASVNADPLQKGHHHLPEIVVNLVTADVVTLEEYFAGEKPFVELIDLNLGTVDVVAVNQTDVQSTYKSIKYCYQLQN